MAMQLFTPLQYLKIDIANSFGHDKEDWDFRIDWFNDNEHKLDELMSEADEPAMFFAGVQAYRKALAGEPSGYPISLDATSSGMQILSLLTGCRKTASICNVIDVGKRMDSYSYIYQVMLDQGRILDASIERKHCKKAIMTALYSSRQEPINIFGKDVEMFYQTMEEEAPGAWALNEAFISMWNPNTDTYRWVMPDNFHVQIKVIDTVKEKFEFMGSEYEISRKVHKPMETGRSLGANTTHSIDGMVVRELTARCSYNPEKIRQLKNHLSGLPVFKEEIFDEDNLMVKILWQHYLDSGFLSARILDHLNRYNLKDVDLVVVKELVDSLPTKPFKVLSIHDCFRCLPAYGNDLRRQYNTIYAMIGKSNLLSFLLTQITGSQVNIEKADDEMWKEVFETNYALS